jgi:hypothetical protein
MLDTDLDSKAASFIKVLVIRERREIGSSGLRNTLIISAFRDCITEFIILNEREQ